MKVTVEYVLGEYPKPVKENLDLSELTEFTEREMAVLLNELKKNYESRNNYIRQNDIEAVVNALDEVEFKVDSAKSKKEVVITERGYIYPQVTLPLMYPSTTATAVRKIILIDNNQGEISLENGETGVKDDRRSIVNVSISYRCLGLTGYEAQIGKINSALEEALLQ